MKQMILLISCLLWVLPAEAQTDTLQEPLKQHQFSISAQHWTRGEFRHGALTSKPKENLALFVMSSTQLTLDYQYKGLEVMIAPKHVGVWGSKGSGTFGLEEGWFSLTHKRGLFFKLGRQKFNYDDQRIIGSDDWVMFPSKHDALKMGFEGGKHKIHLIAAYNQNDENAEGGTYYVDGGQPYKMMQAAWYHFDPWPQMGISALFINTGMQDLLLTDEDVTRFQQLFGGFVDWHPGRFDFEASYYRQTGFSEHNLPIHAWMTSAEAYWRCHPAWRLNAGYFHMSGDRLFYVPPEGGIGMARKTEVRGFNPIFGSHHKFYGAMDFFYVTTYYGGNTPGLQDVHASMKWTPVSKFELNAAYHFLATSIEIEIPGYKKALGHELEFSLSWELVKDVSLQAGYSFMKGTKTMELLKRSTDLNKNRLHWAWIMLVVTPEFFKVKF